MTISQGYIAYSEADAARYAGWYAAEFTGTEPLACELCGSIEDVSHSGPQSEVALCLDCAERPGPLWDPYYDEIYGSDR